MHTKCTHFKGFQCWLRLNKAQFSFDEANSKAYIFRSGAKNQNVWAMNV